uniref:Uncharacterized protein n=1 Tax=Anopheles minimus TaxID=112268 RepID=A0A182WMX2_9DIPT
MRSLCWASSAALSLCPQILTTPCVTNALFALRRGIQISFLHDGRVLS